MSTHNTSTSHEGPNCETSSHQQQGEQLTKLAQDALAELAQEVQCSEEEMLRMFRSIQEEHQPTFLQMCARLAVFEPGPIDVGGELEWEVEEIVRCRIYWRKL